MHRQREAQGHPPILGVPPELSPGLDYIYKAFWDLHTCRPIGMAAGPIPWIAIEEYCNAKCLDDESKEELHHLIRVLDVEYLDHQAKKREAEENKGKRKK